MKNVLLTTTTLVAFAGAAAADVSWSGGVDIGHNDDINGGFFYDASLNLTGSFDLGDGYSASISYGVDLESKADVNNGPKPTWNAVDGWTGPKDWIVPTWGAGNSGLVTDAFPTVEIIAPIGSLKGGDLNDEGASEYFYADRDGMHVDVENHDSATRFDVRALAEFGDFGVAVGGQSAAGGEFSGLNFGAGGTFGDVSFGIGYDDDENGAQVTAISADMTVGGIDLGVSYASGKGIKHTIKTEGNFGDSLAADAYHIGNDPSSYSVDETSIALTASMAVSSEVTVGGYVASNKATFVDSANWATAGGSVLNLDGEDISGVSWGLSVDYASGPVSVSAYYDVIESIGSDDFIDVDADGYVKRNDWDLENMNNSEWGVDFGYEVSADLSVFAGYFDDGAGVSYMGATYAFNDSLTGTVSWAEADEISGPEFKNGTTIMLSASF